MKDPQGAPQYSPSYQPRIIVPRLTPQTTQPRHPYPSWQWRGPVSIGAHSHSLIQTCTYAQPQGPFLWVPLKTTIFLQHCLHPNVFQLSLSVNACVFLHPFSSDTFQLFHAHFCEPWQGSSVG